MERYDNDRKKMIEQIDNQLRKALKQGQRLTIAVWDEDGITTHTLVLLLAEIGRVSWHGNVFIMNMHEQIGQYEKIHASSSTDGMEKIAMLNKLFLVNHYAAKERCEAMSRLIFKMMPEDRPHNENRRLLGSSLGLMLSSPPTPWEKCLAKATARAMHERLTTAGGRLPSSLQASARPEEERTNLLKHTMKTIMKKPCLLTSKRVMFYMRTQQPVMIQKQLDTVIWAMIGANRNDVMTGKEIRDTIRQAREYVKTEEFEKYHKQRLDYLLTQLETNKKLDYASPPIMLKPGKKHPEVDRMEVD